MTLLLTIMLFAAAGGIASAAFAIVFLWVREEHSALILPHFISFATGALLGAALLALLPEAMAAAGPGGAHGIGLALIAGLGVFFVIEKLVLWWHAHAHAQGESAAACAQHADEAHERRHEPAHAHDHARDHASGVLVLVGDSLHNALDGALIAAAFLGSAQLGVLTTLAVAAHEIPHRVGDFAILVQAGLSRSRALLLNLATGVASVFGAVLAYFGLRETQSALPYALAFAAAGFLYIAVAGLIPGLHRRADPRTSAVQVMLIAAGIAVIAGAEQLTQR
ncbi:MAG TPA: ZIP family metal transporter [Steroidobacteraceae bacterium]|jgi:zinc and cadmium transporter|nr:ZIP family metal transporter [Steroidobacteraceae bacterium]